MKGRFYRLNQMTTKPKPDCLFCRIAAEEIPSRVVWQDNELMAFADIRPRAPVHLLLIPKGHIIASVADMNPDHQSLIGRMLWRAKLIADEQGIAGQGYRLVFNVRKHGGQEVDHIHLHILGGQPLGPMG